MSLTTPSLSGVGVRADYQHIGVWNGGRLELGLRRRFFGVWAVWADRSKDLARGLTNKSRLPEQTIAVRIWRVG